jgi:hypothetical protein
MYTRKVDKTNLVIIILIIVLSIIADTMWVKLIENEKRQQARYNLEQIQHCLKYQPKDLSDVSKFYICTSKSRTSPTGDVYVLEIDTLKFVYENSKDIPQGLYYTKGSVGRYFKDWQSAETALHIMLLGKDSNSSHNTAYNFDGGTEWLEWKYSPNDTHIIKGKYIIVQGTQKDEVLGNYTYIRLFATIAVILVVFSLLVSHNMKCGVSIQRRMRDAI